jgi:hypothetical protein
VTGFDAFTSMNLKYNTYYYTSQRLKKCLYIRRCELLKYIGIINSIAAQKINTAAKRRLPEQMNF